MPTAQAQNPTVYAAVQTDGGLFGVFQKVGGIWKHSAWMNAYDIDPDLGGPMPVERHEHWYLFTSFGGQTPWDANNNQRQFRYYGPSMPPNRRPLNETARYTDVEYVVKYRTLPVAAVVAPTQVGGPNCSGRTLCPTYYQIRHTTAGPVVGHVNVFDDGLGKHENFSLLATSGGWLRANATNCTLEWHLTRYFAELPLPPGAPPPNKDDLVPSLTPLPGTDTLDWDRNWAQSIGPLTTTYIAPPPPPSCPP